MIDNVSTLDGPVLQFLSRYHIYAIIGSFENVCISIILTSDTIYGHMSFALVTAPNTLQLRVTAASPGKVNFELDIQKQHTNRLGILHGGTIASMVDTSGSLAVASRGLFSTGVSTDLSVTYLGIGGKVGDTIRGEVVCDKCE